MGILDKIKKTTRKPKSDATKKESAKARPAGDEVKVLNGDLKTQFSIHDKILLERPHVSEKAYGLSSLNRYVFIVAPEATKRDVQFAVQRQFSVTVLQVNMSRKQVLRRRFRSGPQRSFVVKKAMVTVKPGEKIDVFTT